MNKLAPLVLLLLLAVYGCADATETQQQEYNKCTSVCAVIIEGSGDEGLATLEICRQECKKQFLDS